MKANQYWAKTYNIPYEKELSLDHVIALLLYCNFTDLSAAFSATFRRSSTYESDILLIERHSNFHNWGKNLREMIEVYGVLCKNIDGIRKKDRFYHGINIKMYFRNCYAHICGPMSTTLSFVDISIYI